MERRKRILVTPLDWGLGHATRCIPLINALQKQNCEVLLASSGNALTLLKIEFPSLEAFELPAYDPVYPVNGGMVGKMVFQLPKFLKTIKHEHAEVEKIGKANKIDVVISDNRYGCYSDNIRSVFITHQVNILIPADYKVIEKNINSYNHRLIKKFNSCWIPAAAKSIIPRLVNGNDKLETRYIGYLSRFEKKRLSKKYDLLVICSGPEPQRQIFENLLTRQIEKTNLKALMVKGLPGKKNMNLSENGDLTFVDFLDSAQMNEALESSGLVIARSGYSTVMDLAKLGKKAIFIPTPGQTEQEYIAYELMERMIAFSATQKDFNLEQALKESNRFKGFEGFDYDGQLLQNAVLSIL